MSVETDLRVIVALDFACASDVMSFVERLSPQLCRLKVGKELFTAEGPKLVDALINKGFDVFLDLKYHDIPNTVAAACRVAAEQGVWMLNVHASGGRRMMEAAREAVDKASVSPLLIGVTVLTSTAEGELKDVGVDVSNMEQVLRLAALAQSSGLDGVVCSAQETEVLKERMGNSFALVTPGIRLKGDVAGDQRRVVEPGQALINGSDYLVIGRSITAASDPSAALERVNLEVATALATL